MYKFSANLGLLWTEMSQIDAIYKAKEKGYVQTLFGRKIHTPNINSKGPAAGFAKRSAINAPIQGCLLYTSPSPRDRTRSRMPSSA